MILDIFRKNRGSAGDEEVALLRIKGMHCSSCATNIDLTLEDVEGVKSADTNYQKSELRVSFDPQKTNLDQIVTEIKKLGYEVVE